MNHLTIGLKYLNGIYLDLAATRFAGPHANREEVLSITAEMMNLGFIPTAELSTALTSIPKNHFTQVFAPLLITALQDAVGANVVHKPMYPNFPKQVMEADYCELFVNAILHYWSAGSWLPDYDKLPREFAFESGVFKEIGLITEKEFHAIPDRLLSANESLSEIDKATVQWFLDEQHYLPTNISIPFKENICLLATDALVNGDALRFTAFVKTATDVLRVVTHMNGGDISLADNTKFKSMPRKQRRTIIQALEKVTSAEDINRHKNKWIRLFHSLHVGEYGGNLAKIAAKFRNNEKIETFNGAVRKAIDSRQYKIAVSLLKNRPGEFARKLDEIVRKSEPSDADVVITQFGKITDQINTRMLLQLWGHFQRRTAPIKDRLVFPKGSTQKAYLIQEGVPPLRVGVPEKITENIYNTLRDRFAKLPKIKGKVWIDPNLYGCPIPTQQRSASEGLFQAARGTRIPLADKSTLRFFVHWKGQDIDLSATFHDEDFKQVAQVSYTQLRNKALGTYHSGDITRAPNGASEFIDINIDQASSKHRYLVMNLYVYSGPDFGEHEVAFAGWMMRDAINSNEIFEPKTVEQRVSLTGDSRNAIPVIFDLKERKAIWVDLYTKGHLSCGGNNTHSNKPTTQRVLQGMLGLDSKVSLFELLATHASVRAEGFAKTREEADVVFGFGGDVTPFDITTINSEYVV